MASRILILGARTQRPLPSWFQIKRLIEKPTYGVCAEHVLGTRVGTSNQIRLAKTLNMVLERQLYEALATVF